MPPEPRTPDNPDEWLRRDKSNLARARIAAPNPEICFEKAMNYPAASSVVS